MNLDNHRSRGASSVELGISQRSHQLFPLFFIPNPGAYPCAHRSALRKNRPPDQPLARPDYLLTTPNREAQTLIGSQPARQDWIESLMSKTRTWLYPLLALLCGPAWAAMTLTSTDIAPGKPIPLAHIYLRCGGRNISPELTWSGVPMAAKSLVLTMIDVDVKPSQWSHWILVDLPATATSLPQGTQSLPGNAKAIVTNFGDPGYAGPCPPTGTGVHHYEFTIWAMPRASVSFAPDQKATEVIAFLSQRALDRASLTAVVQAPTR
jgi:Raf kinase inhibitor-like YbhB/YbcL family protein